MRLRDACKMIVENAHLYPASILDGLRCQLEAKGRPDVTNKALATIDAELAGMHIGSAR